jgi:hypothetical protein
MGIPLLRLAWVSWNRNDQDSRSDWPIDGCADLSEQPGIPVVRTFDLIGFRERPELSNFLETYKVGRKVLAPPPFYTQTSQLWT